jgi:hypothetical protein
MPVVAKVEPALKYDILDITSHLICILGMEFVVFTRICCSCQEKFQQIQHRKEAFLVKQPRSIEHIYMRISLGPAALTDRAYASFLEQIIHYHCRSRSRPDSLQCTGGCDQAAELYLAPWACACS